MAKITIDTKELNKIVKKWFEDKLGHPVDSVSVHVQSYLDVVTVVTATAYWEEKE